MSLIKYPKLVQRILLSSLVYVIVIFAIQILVFNENIQQTTQTSLLAGIFYMGFMYYFTDKKGYKK